MADTIITLTSPDGATLNTAGTYCEGNIEVVPKLQSKTATTGEIVTADDGYVGLESVDTNPVFEAGKKSEYDAFWDAYQGKGSRDYNYDFAFAGIGWKNSTFKPKYNMRPLRCQNFFAQTAIAGDVEQLLADAGVVLDTSQSTLFTNFAVYATNATRFPTIDMSSFSGSVNLFQGCQKLVGIRKIVVNENVKFDSGGCFNICRALTDLVIEGTIGQTGTNLSWSPLDKASIISVINALSSTTTGLTVTLRLAAVNTAFETSAGAADGSTSDEWTALIATKPNWTINLINS